MKMKVWKKMAVSFSIILLLLMIGAFYSIVVQHEFSNFILDMIIFAAVGFIAICTTISVRNSVNAVLCESGRLVEAAREGRLKVRGDVSKVNSEFQEIIQGMNDMLDAVMTPFTLAVDYAGRIAKGDTPPKITETCQGEFNLLKDNLNSCIDTISMLVDEVGVVIAAGREGKLDQRANADRTLGVWRKILRGVNDAMDAVIGPLNIAAEYVDRIAKGDIPPRIIDTYRGDFNEIKNNLNTCIDVMNGLLKEVNALIRATSDGKLDTRGNEAAFTGSWSELVKGMNSLMEAVAAPVDEMMSVLSRMAVNDYSLSMEKEYAGDWNNLKKATNDVRTRLLRVVEILEHISNGDISDLDDLKQVERRSEKDQLLPALIRMTEAIQSLVADADMLAGAALEGELDTRADAGRHRGDFRKVVEGINNTLDAVLKPIDEAVDCLKEMAGGNLDVAVKGSYQGKHAVIKDALNTTLDSINKILSQVFTAIGQVAVGSQQTSESSQNLSRGAAETACTMEQITSSMNDMSTNTKQNAENAKLASKLAVQARVCAERGNEHMAQMVRAMENISESAANISKIIKNIDEIAFQTNLLALNAAVEAARAGKHGKGFTVVAEEVRNLAKLSAKAASETTEIIEGSIRKTEVGTRIAEETAKDLEEIVQGTAKVTDLFGEIASASDEQALGIGQINEGLKQVDLITQQNSASSEELAAASEEMSTQVEMVEQMLRQFKLRKQVVEDSFTAGASSGLSSRESKKAVKSLELRPAGRKARGAIKKVTKLPAAEEAASSSTTGNVTDPPDLISLDNLGYGNY